MLLLDGKRLTKGKAFSSNGVSYPANWLDLTSREQHEEIGIVYAADPAPVRAWDQRWAWGYLTLFPYTTLFRSDRKSVV